jgi:hypothetical protein
VRKDWDEARGGVAKFQGALTEVTPVLSRLGVTGVGAALSIGGVAGSLNNFTSKTRDLSQTARDIGFTVDQLRTFQALGQRFGMSADTMTGALRNLAGQMYEVKRQGSTFVELQAMNLGKLAGELAKASNPQQFLEKLMEGIRNIPDNEVKRRVSRLMFGTDDISIIVQGLTGPIKDALGEVSHSIGKMSKETEQAAKEFQGHMSDIQEWYDRTYLKVMGPLAKGASGLIKDFEKNGLAGNEQEQATRRALSPLGGEGPTRRERLEGRRSSVQQQLELLDRNPDAADYRRKRDRMVDELRRVGDELERLRQQGGGATLNPSSFGGPAGGGSLIQKAAWGGFGGPLGGYGGGGSGSFGGPLGGSGGGGGLGGGGPLEGNSGAGPLTGGGGSAGPGAGAPDAGAPRGNGSGNKRAARTADMMAWAMDQLRREGVPEQHLRQAAAHLVGQAHMESGLDPNKQHDFENGRPTGYGIYGARNDRRTRMLKWLGENGYAPNSAEGQMRYMAREAMTDANYRKTRRVLMGEGTGNVDADTDTITKNFEAPKRINRRSPAVQNAYRVGPSDGAVRGDTAGPSAEADVPWYQRPRSNEPGKMSRLRDDELEVPGSGERPGDRMMRRFYGEGAPVAKGGKGSLHITLEGFPPGSKAKASMDDLFRDTKVERGRSQMDMT